MIQYTIHYKYGSPHSVVLHSAENHTWKCSQTHSRNSATPEMPLSQHVQIPGTAIKNTITKVHTHKLSHKHVYVSYIHMTEQNMLHFKLVHNQNGNYITLLITLNHQVVQTPKQFKQKNT